MAQPLDKGARPCHNTYVTKGENPMSNQVINTIMQRLEDLTDQMVIHQQTGAYDMVTLLDQEARSLATLMDSEEELLTLPLL